MAGGSMYAIDEFGQIRVETVGRLKKRGVPDPGVEGALRPRDQRGDVTAAPRQADRVSLAADHERRDPYRSETALIVDLPHHPRPPHPPRAPPALRPPPPPT